MAVSEVKGTADRAVVVQPWEGSARSRGRFHTYPTQAEAIRRIGDAYNRTRLTPQVRRLFETWLRWTR